MLPRWSLITPGKAFGFAGRRLANHLWRGLARFARRCLANRLRRIRKVEHAHLLEILTREPATEPLRQINGESLDERGSIRGSLLTRLLKLDDVLPDHPVSGSHGRVHRTDRRLPGGIDDPGHISENGVVSTVKLGVGRQVLKPLHKLLSLRGGPA